MGACRGSHKECSPQPPPAPGGRREAGGRKEGMLSEHGNRVRQQLGQGRASVWEHNGFTAKSMATATAARSVPTEIVLTGRKWNFSLADFLVLLLL